jgi:TolB-like protein
MNRILKISRALRGRSAELHSAASQILNLRGVNISSLVVVIFCALLTGCAVGTPEDLVRFKHYEPQNVFVDGAALPKNIRRVAVLPLVCDDKDINLDEGRAQLEPVLMSELIKTKKFEVVSSDSSFLKNRTTRADWTGEEILPPEFFALLRENSGCDAVLFSRLTVFRAYPPLAVGWRIRLVDAQTGKTIWAADEVFDGGEVAVENGARLHQLTEDRSPWGAPNAWFVQNSPSKFGQYTAARLLATLPPR